MVLVFVATTALVFGIALLRSHAHPAEIQSEATQFALSAPGIMVSALLSAAVLAMVAVATAWRDSRGVRARLRLAPTRSSAAGVLAAVSGMIGLSLATGAICDLAGLRGHGAMAAIAQALQRPTPFQFVLALVTIAIAPGLAEEAFFRGLVQTRLVARWGRWPSIIATAFSFGLVHFDLLQGSVALVAGLFLGWVVERLDGIRPAIVAHAFNNAAFVALASFGSTVDATRSALITLVVMGSVVSIGSIGLLRSPLALERDPQPPHPL